MQLNCQLRFAIVCKSVLGADLSKYSFEHMRFMDSRPSLAFSGWQELDVVVDFIHARSRPVVKSWNPLGILVVLLTCALQHLQVKRLILRMRVGQRQVGIGQVNCFIFRVYTSILVWSTRLSLLLASHLLGLVDLSESALVSDLAVLFGVHDAHWVAQYVVRSELWNLIVETQHPTLVVLLFFK